MYDADAIEAINFEQLATVTDRLLLRRGRPSKHRISTKRIGPAMAMLVTAPPDRASASEQTVFVRAAHRSAVDVTVVLGSAIVTTFVFIAAFL